MGCQSIIFCGEEKIFFLNPPNLPSFLSTNLEGEQLCFSSTPLYYSSDHEDTNEVIDFTDHSYHDLFTPISDHDDDSITVDFSKPPVYDDLSVNEFKTPQIVKALHLERMVC